MQPPLALPALLPVRFGPAEPRPSSLQLAENQQHHIPEPQCGRHEPLEMCVCICQCVHLRGRISDPAPPVFWRQALMKIE